MKKKEIRFYSFAKVVFAAVGCRKKRVRNGNEFETSTDIKFSPMQRKLDLNFSQRRSDIWKNFHRSLSIWQTDSVDNNVKGRMILDYSG